MTWLLRVSLACLAAGAALLAVSGALFAWLWSCGDFEDAEAQL